MNTIIIIRGKRSEWVLKPSISQSQIDEMREDGIEIIVPEYSIPGWIVTVGLIRPWCVLQDIWNLRNPWRN